MALEFPSPRNRSEMLGCLAKLGPFPMQLTRLAEYALRHPDVMAFASCSLIASSAGVSPSTVSRLAVVLGFPSVREFREIFREELRRMSRRH
ncbi:MurR/RpiR family transcriptional regulator [Rhizobium sp. P38BS-XIX]|uniref:MurR/RpiR family transcriptional regulator n=1 Tax=Rhizobium sp. P38BS-XIX TaxID=2726740 RepID=UPI0014572616|nr:MurR/RpiR family transcriptional regulator [Rhizobium sp. P38BS-XIX]NLR97136.1 MurR/RpiR family transcriptional regulator [Rhizobium sp. P38BS-XIX]